MKKSPIVTVVAIGIGAALGFELVLPGGGAYTSLAADNPPEK